MKKLIIIPIIILLTGCWNYYELNNIAITTGIAIDKTDDKYEVTYLISNTKNEINSKELKASITTYSGIGDTIQEAINDLKIKMPFEPYSGHLVITIISDEIAREGISNILDFLAREKETRNFFYLLLSKNTKAKNILEIISPLETFPSQTIAKDIEASSKESSLIYEITYNDFIYDLIEQGKNPVLNSVTIIEDNKTDTNSLKIDTLGIFKEDKLLGWATPDESKGINLLSNNVKNLYIKTKCEDKYIINYIENIKTKTKIDLKNNKVNIKINGIGKLLEVNCKINLENKFTINKLEQDIKDELNKIIAESLNLLQNKYKTDVLGYGEIIHKKQPKEWKKIKNNWEEIFKNLKIETEININIENQGSLIQTIKEEE